MHTDDPHRQELLARIKAALGREDARTPAPPATAGTRTVAAGTALRPLFVKMAKAAGMGVQETTAENLAVAIRALLEYRKLAHVAVSVEETALRLLANQAVSNPVRWQEHKDLDALYDADACVTDVLAVIAETGSLVVHSSESTTRGGFLVPGVHIALVRASQILPDMADLWPILRPIPTSVVLITGPSKTADIEGILITGVHGPKEVHILLITDA
jgi:L-lactate dehydrogenase complex protein LldG